MKLKISNFSRIKKAEIEVDGITVIAGHNDTGKSTIGKILFSLFNSLYDIENKIYDTRYGKIRSILSTSISNYIEHETNLSISELRKIRVRLSSELTRNILNLKEEFLNRNNFYKIIRDTLDRYNIPINQGGIDELIDYVLDKINETVNLSDLLVTHEIISRYFTNIFSGQINCLKKEPSEARLTLTIKDKRMSTSFKNNNCVSYESSYNILHEAFYIDNPFIIDELSNNMLYDSSDIKGHILLKLTEDNDIMDGIIDSVIAKEKLEDIYIVLNGVIDGNVVNVGETLGLDNKKYSEPIKLPNLSTGLKSFVIIKMLLEKGILKEKDVLILDEPEIHLHPEWQLIYAEIIVLLQKIFDLSIVVTTHSSNFLESIDYFSKKYSVNSKCRYYMASSVDGMNIFENVTDNLDKIYAQMIQSSVLLDKLKYEMESADDE